MRFRQVAKDIDDPEPRPATGQGTDIALMVLFLTLRGTLFVFPVIRQMA